MRAQMHNEREQRRTALKAAWHVVVHLLVLETDVTQVLATPWFATVVLVVQGNAASAAATSSDVAGQRRCQASERVLSGRASHQVPCTRLSIACSSSIKLHDGSESGGLMLK